MRFVGPLVGVAAAVVVAAGATTVTGPAGATTVTGPAGAATLSAAAATNTSGCVATAPLPARLSLGRSGHVRISSTLTGNDACTQWEDDGVTADLVGPGGHRVAQLDWPHAFGQTASHDLWADDVRPGRYTISNGAVHLFTSSYAPLSSQWVPTSAEVRYAGRFAAVHETTSRHGLTITAKAQRFASDDLFHGFGGVRVSLQSRTGSSWTAASSATANGKGAVRFTVRSGTYRLTFGTTRTVWGATSRPIGAGSRV